MTTRACRPGVVGLLAIGAVCVGAVVATPMLARPDTSAARLLLDDFEGTLRVVQSTETDPQYRYLWSQYREGQPASRSTEQGVTTEAAHDGSQSLRLRLDTNHLYLQFYPHDGAQWHHLRRYALGPWRLDTFTRLRFWMKLPPSVVAQAPGRHNIELGTYVRRSTGSPRSAEDGGGHWYHLYNVPYTGEWHQVIVDTHPSHLRGGPGGKEWADRPYPTGESGYNYFDALTRFYVAYLGPVSAEPSVFYFDTFELYREGSPENVEQVYGLHGTYVPRENRILVGWSRNKDENTVSHEVRYAFRDVHAVGWDAATPAPNGTVAPGGWQGYNGMVYETRAIDVKNESVVYVAIKPRNAKLFRQIAIPLAPSIPARPVSDVGSRSR